MKKSITRQETTPAESMVLRPGTAHLEPFNGSNAMLLIRGFADERKSVDPLQAIITVRVECDFVWTRTMTIDASP
jgi:hypothetical protein